MKLSVVIPAYNEEGCIEATLRALSEKLTAEQIDHELVVVNDNSTDGTGAILQRLCGELHGLRPVTNTPPHGYGFAVRKGLDVFAGDCVAVYMADASDRPEDLVRFFRIMESKNVDCVFGSRFRRGATIIDYPLPKLIINRAANLFVQVLFGLRYNDITNAFKLYRREVIDGVRPIISYHFNLTVELPLKAIVRGFSYETTHNDWVNRKSGVSKLKIHEMGSRYLFIVLYCFIEKWLSRKDYHRKAATAPGQAAPARELPGPPAPVRE